MNNTSNRVEFAGAEANDFVISRYKTLFALIL